MEFKHTMEFGTTEEINETFAGGNKHLSDLIVDTILEELESDIQEIPIVVLTARDDELIYEVTANRDDLVETLEQNLETMEDYEDYERCQKIVSAIQYLKTQTS
jgi:ATP/maltotriose-dependent transcriptional regulator MalT